MKKVLALVVLVAMPSVALAGAQNMAGCGLGSMLFKENQMVHQIVAATTNGCFGNQTFGITTGTLGCTQDGRVAKNKERIVFVESNFISLKRDMAVGQGQYLNSLATLFGYQTPTEKEHFCKFIQTHYENLIPTETTTPIEVIERLESNLPVRS
ncbi:MAG TPA: Orotate phosphoribosyltransferase [Elusimicrobia bacterium]|nr:Orotate phosphoribosyltransferase [Elusimicrobiota bacterium]